MMERPRITFEVTPLIRHRFDKLIKPVGHGIVRMLFEQMTDELLDCIEKNPPAIIGLILSGKLHLTVISDNVSIAIAVNGSEKKDKKIDPKKVLNTPLAKKLLREEG